MGHQTSAFNDVDLYSQHADMVSDRLRFGAMPEDIARQLVGFGMTAEAAEAMVAKLGDTATPRNAPVRANSRPAAPRGGTGTEFDDHPFRAVGAALAAAIVGGCVWGLVAKVTGYELGLLAWGIGALCAYAAVLGSGGYCSPLVRFGTLASSVLGIALGKYLSFIVMWNEFVGFAGELAFEASEDGIEAVEPVSEATSELAEMMTINFMNGFSTFVDMGFAAADWMDGLWIVLAVGTAWKILGEESDG